MARDLPAELWSEVISHLPRGYARKLLGINRCLTEIALDEIYHSFTLDNGFRRAVSDIQRTTESKYASRVKRLDVYSNFLARSPEADEDLITHDLSRIPSASRPPKPAKKSPIRALGKRLGSLMVSSLTPGGIRLSGRKQNNVPNPTCVRPKVLAAINVALSRWSQLEEINLILHDFVMMPTFSDFLVDLWSQRAESIRILNIDVSPSGLFNFLEISEVRLTPLSNLEHLSLKFTPLEDHMFPWDQKKIGNKLAKFIGSHRHSLHTLMISEPLFVKWTDTSTMIQGLGSLPRLKKIELPVLVEQVSYSRSLQYLETFLHLNAHTLECLIMVYRRSYPFSPPGVYWQGLLNDTYQVLLYNILPRLCFPKLSELDMDIYAGSSQRLITFCLPPLRQFAPNIRKLTLNGSNEYLTDFEFPRLLENLSTGAPLLRSFQFKLEVFSPEHLDQLACNLPMLESLSITYTMISAKVGGPFESSPAALWETINREYVNWSLKYLRLARTANCEGGHPDFRLNARVAKWIPGLEVNDTSRSCRSAADSVW